MRLPMAGEAIDAAIGERMVDEALAAGLNYFDTAYMYHGGESEKFAGAALARHPRDSFMLASKMPLWMAKDAADMERIFAEQLERCRTPYFDFYLVHAMSADKAQKFRDWRVGEFLDRKKAEGKIRHAGCSFHDTPEALREVLTLYPWEFTQIQLNYLDWNLYRSREQYEALVAAGIPVIVMEPVRGGALANLTPEAVAVFRRHAPEASPASWAMRFAASLPGVVCVLSGMSSLAQMRDNLRTFSPLKPLADVERAALEEALAAYRKGLAVPCTACRYCQPCPAGVEIPTVFGHYNQYKASGNQGAFKAHYQSLPEKGRAEACVACGQCVAVCPQHIDVPARLREIAAAAA
ncbi:MAG: aldo/keto reductase, partial [Planctomycetes bacterium]|nr:aldo/keto reductase [Planctomycetota bacterium]